jgi:hypothetical protein
MELPQEGDEEDQRRDGKADAQAVGEEAGGADARAAQTAEKA